MFDPVCDPTLLIRVTILNKNFYEIRVWPGCFGVYNIYL